MASHCIGYKCSESRIWNALVTALRNDGAVALPRATLKLAYHPTFAVLMATGLCLLNHAGTQTDSSGFAVSGPAAPGAERLDHRRMG
jgi:hypothetical protein